MTTSESSKAGGQGNGARAITRGEEARVREAVMRALALQDFTLAWNDDDTLWAISGWTGAEKATGAIERERLAAEGIVPGPEGWCWAAPVDRDDECIGCSHSLGSHDRSDGSCIYCNCPTFVTATAAAPHDFDPLCEACKGETTHTGPLTQAPPAWLTAAVLAALPADGTPRGFSAIVQTMLADRQCADWFRHGGEPDGATRAALAHLVSTGEIEAGEQPGTWRRPLPKPAPSPPSPPVDRPARLRVALLAVLAPGPVHTTAALLPALDAAMGERAGVAVATGAEAMKAAREVGARVDGVEWSLPAVPDGWGWRRPIASRWYLAPLDASDPEREAVASLTVDDGVGGIGGLMWRVKGEMWQGCASVEEGQAAALTAARLAGLFAAPRAEVAPVAAPAPAAPTMADATAALAAFRAEILAVALPLSSRVAAAWSIVRASADPLHRVALAVSAARRRLAADRATLDAVGRLREALTALCAGPGAWRWAVDESAPDAAARLIGEMSARIADFETVQRVADAHRQEMRASRDAALAELTRVREGIAAVMGAIAGGREVGK